MSKTDPFLSTIHQWMEIFVHRSMRDYILYVRESGFSMSQLGALFHLHHKGSSDVTGMGDHLGVTSAAASQMLDRLVEQGLIQRTEDRSDRRVKRIALTEQGYQVLEAGIRARVAWLDDLREVLSEQEKAQVTSALAVLIKKTSQLDPALKSEI